MTADRRTLLAIFSLAFGLRMLFAAVLGSNPEIVPVHETYDFQIAARMARDFSWITTPFSPNAPGYLILLAAAFRVAGASWWTSVVLNSFLGGLTALFLYRIGERRIGRGAGLVAALWLGLSVRHMSAASDPMRDVTTTFLLAWLIYAMVLPFRRMRDALTLAILFTLLISTEPVFIVLLPVLLVYLGRYSTHHRELSVQYLFLFVATLLFINIPWTIRNYVVHRDVVPVSLETSRYTAPLARLLRDEPPPVDTAPGVAVVHAPGFVHNSIEFWRAVRVRDAPADPVHGLVAEPAWSLRHNLAGILTYGLLLPFALVGTVLAVKRRHRATLIMAGTIVSYAVVRGFTGGDDRARLVVEPLLILVAVYGARALLAARHAPGDPTIPAV